MRRGIVYSAVAAGAVLLALAASDLQADTIYRTKGTNLERVQIFNETFQVVEYYPPGGMKIKQSIRQNEVERVEYDNWPIDYEDGKLALKESRFQDAYNAFMGAAGANDEDYPQAEQYGLFWAAETCRKWAQAGNGSALNEALKIYNELIARKPDTVHLAKVHVGLGNCFLLMGKKNEAVAEFNKVLNEDLFKVADKVSAKVAMAHVAELEGKYRNALNKYDAIKDEAAKYAPETLPLVKVRMASCKVGLEQYDEALGDFNRILSSAKAPEVRAGAYNGRGECHWKKKQYEKGMWDFLRVVVLYETVTTESPKAFYYASLCMRNVGSALRDEGKKDEERKWRYRARELMGELKTKFPGSSWAKK